LITEYFPNHHNRTGAEVQAVDSPDRSLPRTNAPWSPATGTLGRLTHAAHQRAEALAHTLPALRERASARPAPPSFADALRRPSLAVIAEIKRASPSKGAIAPTLDARTQALAYAAGGAAAISVLTEPSEFGGSLDDLAAVADGVSIPVLRKDFIVHPVQIWEARANGAAAVLLIARALAPEALAALHREAEQAGLAVLVEVRDEAELQRALDIGATIIGVNNRNLETLVIDPATAPRVIRSMPSNIIAIAESGMSRPEDALAAQAAGADALLIGSAISAAADPMLAVSAFASLPRQPR
jgi:indole-3-glycerol phosphate synthase